MSQSLPERDRFPYVLASIPRYPEGDERSEWFSRTYVTCGPATAAGTPLLAGGRTILVVTEADAAQRLCRLLNRAGNVLAHGQLDNGDRAFSIGIDAAYQLEDFFHDLGIVLAATPLI